MRLFEYQAKELFAEAGIPVPRSALVRAGEQLAGAETDGTGSVFAAGTGEAAEALLAGSTTPGSSVVVKAQLLMGGRGKAGLIKPATTAGEAATQARGFFTGPHTVRTVLVEEAIQIASELYLSISPDPTAGYSVGTYTVRAKPSASSWPAKNPTI